MSVPERTPLQLVEMTGDRDAAGPHPWDTRPPTLELGDYPAFPPTVQYEPEPMDLRDAAICVFVGAVSAFAIGFILWGDKIVQRLAELFLMGSSQDEDGVIGALTGICFIVAMVLTVLQ